MNKTKKTTPTRDTIYEQFKDDGTKITDHHLTSSCKDHMEMFRIALWGVWLMEAYDRTDGPSEDDLGELTNEFFNLQSKIQKALEFAELCQHATGFDVPEDTTFHHIDLDALKAESKT